MHKKLIGLALIVLAIVLTLGWNKSTGGNSLLGGAGVSSNILYITSPVTSFSGTVEKISGDTVTVSQTITQQTLLAAPVAAVPVAGKPVSPTPSPTPVAKKITYAVKIDKTTSVSRTPAFVPYLLKQTASTAIGAQNNTTVKDLKVGDNVSVNSATDLRTLQGNSFSASSVTVAPVTNTINGRVVSVRGNTIVVKGFQPISSFGSATANANIVPQEKEYRVEVTGNTEISRYDNTETPPKPEKLSVSDLKKDTQVTVYTSEDVTKASTVTALRIEPFQAPIAIVQPTTTPTATTSATPATPAVEKTVTTTPEPTKAP